MKRLEFFKEGLKQIWTVGTFVRSSRKLCKRIVRNIDFKKGQNLVELGAGDGVITKHILKAMPEDSRLMVFELNEKFCEVLRKIDDDRLIVVEDDASKLGEYLEKHDMAKADVVVSALPLVMFPKETAIDIIKEIRKNMRSGASYIQVHYSLMARKWHEKIFGKVRIQFELFNLPPTYLHIAEA